MDTATTGLSAFLVAYFVGSIPFGYLTARVVSGTDILELGSGNIGATNVARILGARWGVAVLVRFFARRRSTVGGNRLPKHFL